MVKLSHHDMANFIEGMNLEAYFDRMACDGVLGDHLVLLGLSHALDRPIRVVLSSTSDSHHVVIETSNSIAAPILLGLVGEHYYISLSTAVIGHLICF